MDIGTGTIGIPKLYAMRFDTRMRYSVEISVEIKIKQEGIKMNLQNKTVDIRCGRYGQVGQVIGGLFGRTKHVE